MTAKQCLAQLRALHAQVDRLQSTMQTGSDAHPAAWHETPIGQRWNEAIEHLDLALQALDDAQTCV